MPSSAPASPMTPSLVSSGTTPIPGKDGLTPILQQARRNRAGSTSGVDLGPYRLLLKGLEEEAEEHEGLEGKQGEVMGALRMLLDHVDGLVSPRSLSATLGMGTGGGGGTS